MLERMGHIVIWEVYRQQTDPLIAEAYLRKARDAYWLKNTFSSRFGHFCTEGKTYGEGMAIVNMTALKMSLASHIWKNQHCGCMFEVEIVGVVRRPVQPVGGTEC